MLCVEMRYHKAVAITKPEADYLMATATSSLSDTIVISHGEKWYDVRAMTPSELAAFVADLARAEFAAHNAQMYPPN